MQIDAKMAAVAVFCPLPLISPPSFSLSAGVAPQSTAAAPTAPASPPTQPHSKTALEARSTRKPRPLEEVDLSSFGRVVVFDLETQLSATDVGGWQNAHLMRVAVGVVYDSWDKLFHTYHEPTVDALLNHLESADVVCGFNIVSFDYKVLSAYARHPLGSLPTCDLLAEIKETLNLRIGLSNLAAHTLSQPKSADGLQSLEWFAQGRLDLVERYCRDDVEITRDLLRFGLANGYVVGHRKRCGLIRLPVRWSLTPRFQGHSEG